jgi:excinuclease ABC subunit C
MPPMRDVRTVPDAPGTYIIKSDDGETLYVGKARSLRKRLATWFGSRPKHSPWVDVMMRHAAGFDYIVTGSEMEALILESNLIKEHRPKYNVKLADDKSYPYLKLTLEEPFPRLRILRELPRDSVLGRPGRRTLHDPRTHDLHRLREGRYFGPYASAKAMRGTMRIVQELFRICSCNRKLVPGRRSGSVCLQYHIGRCMGPCTGKVSPEKYRDVLDDVILFLKGKHTDVVKRLREEMEAAAQALDFERAARLRDKSMAIEKAIEGQRVVARQELDEDVLAVATADGRACVQTFRVRAGKLIDQEHYMLDNAVGHDEAEVLEGFVKQFYDQATSLPREALVSERLEDADVLGEWLSSMAGVKVRVFRPQRGEKRRLVDMARSNAAAALAAHMKSEHERQLLAESAMAELQESLGLARMPRRIEAYDISNTSGREAVGSLVVFQDAEPYKTGYRRFKMRSTEGKPDDYAMMEEMLTRRCRRAGDGDEKFATLPDLILVDGGRGQLNVALRVLGEFEILDMDVVGLAKEFEQIHAPGRDAPLELPDDSRARLLLQRVRDEAHRFARTYHTALRDRRVRGSPLEEVRGIGPARRRALLRHFRSMRALRSASVDELRAVKGMTEATTRALHAHLHASADSDANEGEPGA